MVSGDRAPVPVAPPSRGKRRGGGRHGDRHTPDHHSRGKPRRLTMATEHLIGHDLFELLRPDQVRAISETAEEISLFAGDTVFQRGEKADYLFAVLDGQVALRLTSKEGLSTLIDEVTRGAIFGSCICFQFESYSLTARCTEDSRLLKIRAATLKKLLDNDPVLGYEVQKLISRIYFKRYVDTAQKLQAILRAIPVEAV
jgi:signal-transduction protein with cAMP-binding, CBS, and nucleotidyltransferase domain